MRDTSETFHGTMGLQDEVNQLMQTRRIFPLTLALFVAVSISATFVNAQNPAPPPPAPAPNAPDMAGADGARAGTSIGGKWMESKPQEEKMTGLQRMRFELEADNVLRGGEAHPKVILFCVGGKLKLGDFRPNVQIGRPNRASFVGRPQLKVRVRVNNSNYTKNWNWVNGDFLAMDEDTVRKLIGSSVFKIQFDTPDGPQIAEFSPAGLDLAKVRQDCKLKPMKP